MATITLQQAPTYNDIRGIDAHVRGSNLATDYVALTNTAIAGGTVVLTCNNVVDANLRRMTEVIISYQNPANDTDIIAISSIQP
jgi:hypothetical protein